MPWQTTSTGRRYGHRHSSKYRKIQLGVKKYIKKPLLQWCIHTPVSQKWDQQPLTGLLCVVSLAEQTKKRSSRGNPSSRRRRGRRPSPSSTTRAARPSTGTGWRPRPSTTQVPSWGQGTHRHPETACGRFSPSTAAAQGSSVSFHYVVTQTHQRHNFCFISGCAL